MYTLLNTLILFKYFTKYFNNSSNNCLEYFTEYLKKNLITALNALLKYVFFNNFLKNSLNTLLPPRTRCQLVLYHGACVCCVILAFGAVSQEFSTNAPELRHGDTGYRDKLHLKSGYMCLKRKKIIIKEVIFFILFSQQDT